MSDHLTLDVVDRPAGGVFHAMRTLRGIRATGPPGLRALLRLGTGHFSKRPYPRVTPRRIGVLAVWESAEALEGWEPVLSPLCHGAREHWHLAGEITRAAFSEPWHGWTPEAEDAVPLGDDEPVLILISGHLRPKFFPAFMSDGAKAVRQAYGEPGYLGGLAINSTFSNTSSCSAWRTYAEARDYAVRPGAHAEAMRRDRAGDRHTTEWFLRVRPLAERGTLAGQAPFGGLLNAATANGDRRPGVLSARFERR